MGRLKPEDQVKKLCLSRLEQWQKWGYVIDYDDVSNLGRKCIRGRYVMHTKEGKRDIIAIIKVKDKAWVYLIEVKASKNWNWSQEQQVYAEKFVWLNNVIYEVVNDPNKIDNTLEEITGYCPENILPSKLEDL